MSRDPYDWDEDEEYDDDLPDDEDEDDGSDDDVEDEPEADDDADDEEEDEDEVFGRIERAFREERARVRACDDLHELRSMRARYTELAEGRGREAGRIRARDLVELIDDRITDLKAERMRERDW